MEKVSTTPVNLLHPSPSTEGDSNDTWISIFNRRILKKKTETETETLLTYCHCQNVEKLFSKLLLSEIVKKLLNKVTQ